MQPPAPMQPSSSSSPSWRGLPNSLQKGAKRHQVGPRKALQRRANLRVVQCGVDDVVGGVVGGVLHVDGVVPRDAVVAVRVADERRPRDSGEATQSHARRGIAVQAMEDGASALAHATVEPWTACDVQNLARVDDVIERKEDEVRAAASAFAPSVDLARLQMDGRALASRPVDACRHDEVARATANRAAVVVSSPHARVAASADGVAQSATALKGTEFGAQRGRVELMQADGTLFVGRPAPTWQRSRARALRRSPARRRSACHPQRNDGRQSARLSADSGARCHGRRQCVHRDVPGIAIVPRSRPRGRDARRRLRIKGGPNTPVARQRWATATRGARRHSGAMSTRTRRPKMATGPDCMCVRARQALASRPATRTRMPRCAPSRHGPPPRTQGSEEDSDDDDGSSRLVPRKPAMDADEDDVGGGNGSSGEGVARDDDEDEDEDEDEAHEGAKSTDGELLLKYNKAYWKVPPEAVLRDHGQALEVETCEQLGEMSLSNSAGSKWPAPAEIDPVCVVVLEGCVRGSGEESMVPKRVWYSRVVPKGTTTGDDHRILRVMPQNVCKRLLAHLSKDPQLCMSSLVTELQPSTMNDKLIVPSAPGNNWEEHTEPTHSMEIKPPSVGAKAKAEGRVSGTNGEEAKAVPSRPKKVAKEAKPAADGAQDKEPPKLAKAPVAKSAPATKGAVEKRKLDAFLAPSARPATEPAKKASAQGRAPEKIPRPATSAPAEVKQVRAAPLPPTVYEGEQASHRMVIECKHRAVTDATTDLVQKMIIPAWAESYKITMEYERAAGPR